MKQYDMSQFVNYCKENVNNDYDFKGTQESLLQFWGPAKDEYLYKLMGEKLILSKQITIPAPSEVLEQQMAQAIHNDSCPKAIINLKNKVLKACNARTDAYCMSSENAEYKLLASIDTVLDALWSPNSMVNNKFDHEFDTFVVNGLTVSYCENQKMMKVIGKIAKAVNAEDDFEVIRVAHAQALNQKKLNGELCLSIHPLDYATASDNDCDWESCMSWRSEGCYRMGTVEMMNSPMVICSYLSASNIMEAGGKQWNSKKWRAWVVLTKDCILCQKNYPYQSPALAKLVINWVEELAKANLGWTYSDNVNTLCDWVSEGYQFRFRTNLMYNDTYGDVWMKIGSDVQPIKHYEINFSGVANCMNCGERYYGDDADTLCCEDCHEVRRCTGCGAALYGDAETYWGPDDEPYCEDCFNEAFGSCDTCGDLVDSEDLYSFQFMYDTEAATEFVSTHKEEYPLLYQRYLNYWHSSINDTVIFPVRERTERTICKACINDALEHDVDFDDTRIYGSGRCANVGYGYTDNQHYYNSFENNWINPFYITEDQFIRLLGYSCSVKEPLMRFIYNNYKNGIIASLNAGNPITFPGSNSDDNF